MRVTTAITIPGTTSPLPRSDFFPADLPIFSISLIGCIHGKVSVFSNTWSYVSTLSTSTTEQKRMEHKVREIDDEETRRRIICFPTLPSSISPSVVASIVYQKACHWGSIFMPEVQKSKFSSLQLFTTASRTRSEARIKAPLGQLWYWGSSKVATSRDRSLILTTPVVP